MNFLVVGAGSIGCRHLGNLVRHPDVLNIAIADPNPVSQTKARAVHNRIRRFDSTLEAMNNFPTDAAIICTPPALHSEPAVNLISAGVPVLIEKPLAHNMIHANAIAAAEESFSVPGVDAPIVAVGYSLRFHPAIQFIRDELLPHIGQVRYARAEVGQYLPDWHPGEDHTKWYMSYESQGGGALLDLSHEIDYLLHMFGQVHNARGVVKRMCDITVDSDDIAEFTMSFRNRMIASVHMDLIDRNYNRRLRIVGDNGSIDWDWNRGTILNGVPNPKYGTGIQEYRRDRNIQFEQELAAFIQSIQQGYRHENLCSVEEAIDVLSVVRELKGSWQE